MADFSADSDVDVLVSFEGEAPWDLWDLIEMREQLGRLLQREVDLVEKDAISNPYRRRHILNHREVIYDRPTDRVTRHISGTCCVTHVP